ncbi:uncharacterized protein LOC110806429, partial [Carica papaya]|uniref:uncharacterized protein LOC110806429 n=1 Tax=Carica papaya TaxID=3649 RepID=UPI000B8C8F03
GDRLFLKFILFKDISMFGKKKKLNFQFIGLFKILDRVGTAAYRLTLPTELFRVHNVFYESMLGKYDSGPSHVLSYEPFPLQKDLSYEKVPVGILDKKSRVLRSREIPIVKVLWQNHLKNEATWELKSDFRTQYPQLLD